NIGPSAVLGTHRRWQPLSSGELRQPPALLFLGAAADDQLCGDFRTRAKRTDPDIAARELRREDAHRLLAEPEAAMLLRDGEAEHADLRHLRNDIKGDIAVGAVPVLRPGCDLALRELSHLVADRRQRVVEAAVADRRI